jgi:glycosyltransferase involved in cell wall biosynthesis
MTNDKWLIIAWAPHSRRSDMFAKELGGKLYCVHYLKFQSPPYAPFKYILQTIRTLQLLFRDRPRFVHVQNPPFVCGLVVYLFSCIFGAQFVLDHHSAAFASTWNWALFIQKFLARRAVTNIVTNQYWADIVHAWGAHALIMVDPFLDLPSGETFSVKPGFNVAFIGTYAPDEPLNAVLSAAAQLPEINIYITGDTKRVSRSFLENLPPNVTCTGFLPDGQYIGLLRAVDAIMVLTTRNYTLQLGGCEAVSIGKPLITSDWPYLRQTFVRGTLYVPNTAAGIRDGISNMQNKHKELEKEVIIFRQDSRREWDVQFTRLQKMIADQVENRFNRGEVIGKENS